MKKKSILDKYKVTFKKLSRLTIHAKNISLA